MKMAYIATNPKTNDCYAICSADPDFLTDAAEEIAQWKKDGAVIELLSKDDALKRFAENLPEPDWQMDMFSNHLDGNCEKITTG